MQDIRSLIPEGLPLLIYDNVQDIRELKREGYTHEAAIAKVRERSTLGAISWESVLSIVNEKPE